MKTVTFLVSKHPYGHFDGETAISRLLMQAAAESFAVDCIALATGLGPRGPFPVRVVPKGGLFLPRVVGRSLLARRSAIHVRFAPPALVQAIEANNSDHLVARRLYMAEGPLQARRPVDVLVDVLESHVLRARGGSMRPALAVEARRTARDEQRCMAAARSLAALGEDEAVVARAVANRAVPRLDVVLRPHGDGPPAEPRPPVALYLGDRRWAPNLAGLRRLYRLWPAILQAAPSARLLVVGAAGRREPPPPDGVEVTGFVDDLGTVWDSARLLIAPITIGGGVRVKLLEAASRGVPVVGTRAAVGSTSAYLPLTGSDDDDMLISRCAEFLTDGRAALAAGHDLWEANADCWRSGRLAHAVAEWLGR